MENSPHAEGVLQLPSSLLNVTFVFTFTFDRLLYAHLINNASIAKYSPKMPQSHTQLYAHLIFSTKNRYPFLDDRVCDQVHAYLATLLRKMDSPYVVVGGVADHVHVLFDLGKRHTPVEFVEKIKKDSSKFVKTLGASYEQFYWQRGYGLFSVSPTHRDDVECYIRNQEEHHRRHSFQEEYLSFLKRYGIAYDERYLWD